MDNNNTAVFWFRRDLRLHDNHGLYKALSSGMKVVPVFIFDTEILDKLTNKQDPRLTFIHQALADIQAKLKEAGSSLFTYYGKPEQVWANIISEHQPAAVFTNQDYEPYAIKRDSNVEALLASKGVAFHKFKDQAIFDNTEVLKDDGKPYTVFTPYSRKWKARLAAHPIQTYPSETQVKSFKKNTEGRLIALADMGFSESKLTFPTTEISDSILKQYSEKRDYPAKPGTSRLSVHLRFGTVSIRELAVKGVAHSESWLNELIWRDFYFQILWHFPYVDGAAFKPQYDKIRWEDNEEHFKAWCEGKTGYPIVDAGMRELNTTGFMHNRVRMIVASFLVKHLLIDWRRGEAYFAEKLLDFDLSANNGGWQWAAGSGCDAAPYFRIFNPALQTKKFDPELQYIKRWVPEINSLNYRPIIDHEFARKRCLARFAEALKE